MFEAEAAGLREINRSGKIRVLKVIAVGETEEKSWIGMEFIALGSVKASSQADLGRQLVLLHQTTAGRFGWERESTIGITLQRNQWRAN
ncbi:MAG: hypothetical protein M2R45_00306 [Verrucomicrobia subdivision 3 bacterium]|nr:hypothetical protein [Limisphaerales bacterium]MCS1412935.1 hypothetical protein [Limisphaerales bacterium]